MAKCRVLRLGDLSYGPARILVLTRRGRPRLNLPARLSFPDLRQVIESGANRFELVMAIERIHVGARMAGEFHP